MMNGSRGEPFTRGKWVLEWQSRVRKESVCPLKLRDTKNLKPLFS